MTLSQSIPRFSVIVKAKQKERVGTKSSEVYHVQAIHRTMYSFAWHCSIIL